MMADVCVVGRLGDWWCKLSTPLPMSWRRLLSSPSLTAVVRSHANIPNQRRGALLVSISPLTFFPIEAMSNTDSDISLAPARRRNLHPRRPPLGNTPGTSSGTNSHT